MCRSARTPGEIATTAQHTLHKRTRSSATADGPRDALSQSKSRQLLDSCMNNLQNNSTTTSLINAEHYSRLACNKRCSPSHDASTLVSVVNKLDRQQILLKTRLTCRGEIF